MMRSVGDKNRSPFVLDPQEAWRLGRRADAQLLAIRDVRSRGVIRAPHRTLNELDDQRQLHCARRVAEAR